MNLPYHREQLNTRGGAGVAERDRLLSDCRALNSTESSNLSLPAKYRLFYKIELPILYKNTKFAMPWRGATPLVSLGVTKFVSTRPRQVSTLQHF